MNIETRIETVLRRRFGRVDILESRSVEGEERLMLKSRHLVDALRFLQSDPDTQIDILTDISAIHHIKNAKSCIYSLRNSFPCFEVFYLLRSTRLDYRLRLSIFVPEHLPSVPSLTNLFQNSEWLEREIWDLFGIWVEGQPHLRRLLLYQSFIGHPLRKEYDAQQAQPIVPIKGHYR